MIMLLVHEWRDAGSGFKFLLFVTNQGAYWLFELRVEQTQLYPQLVSNFQHKKRAGEGEVTDIDITGGLAGGGTFEW